MTRMLALALAAGLLGGCASCGKDPADGGRHDADRDADVESPEDAETQDADRDAEPDVELPEGAEPMRLVEIPHDRAGLDCGRGCRQISFGDSVRRFRYDVSERYVVYQGGDGSSASPYLIDLQDDSEHRLMRCDSDRDPLNCTAPAVDGEHVVFSTRPWEIDLEWTIWRYEVGDRFRTPIAFRTVLKRDNPTNLFDLYEGTVLFWDGVDYPPGIYTMPLAGGEVVKITPATCCFNSPRIWGRQVVYGSDEPGEDVWMVDLDTLERRNLTNHPASQFWPAFDGQWVVWNDGRNDPNPTESSYLMFNNDIYGLRLPDGPAEALCTDPAAQTSPDVNSGLVAWVDFRNADEPNEGDDWDADTDIYLLDLETRREVRVTSLEGPQLFPRLWGRRLFYLGPDLRGEMAIFMVDLDEAGLLDGGSR